MGERDGDVGFGLRSLVAEGPHGVDLRGTQGWEETGQERHEAKQEGDAGKGQRVGGSHAKEQILQETRQQHRDDEADGNAN